MKRVEFSIDEIIAVLEKESSCFVKLRVEPRTCKGKCSECEFSLPDEFIVQSYVAAIQHLKTMRKIHGYKNLIASLPETDDDYRELLELERYWRDES